MKLSNKKVKELFGIVIEGQQLLYFNTHIQCFYCLLVQSITRHEGVYTFNPIHSEDCRYNEKN